MPARHSETSAGTSDDSETPGDRGPGRHITEGSETSRRINSGVKSLALALGEPNVLGASPRAGSEPCCRIAMHRIYCRLTCLSSMRTLVANANSFKVSASLDLRALKPSHDAKKRAKPSRCGSLWSYRRSLPVHYSFAARVDQSASATSFPCTSGDVSRLARREPRAKRLSLTA